MVAPTYVIDSDVFIQAARNYYAFDFAPRFWESLIEHAAKGHVASIDRVQEELHRGKDDLAAWADNEFQDAFASTADTDVIEAYRHVIEWAQAQPQYSDAAKAEFADVADGWLVAYAKAKGCVLVTQEELAPEARRRVPIPNVCEAFNVQWVHTYAMLRGLGVTFA